MNDRILHVDEHLIVACPAQDALTRLDGPTAIASWFGCKREGSRTTISSVAGDLVLERAYEEWKRDEGALLVVGTTGDLWFRAHLSVCASLHSGTEIRTHVELGPADRALRARAVIHDVLRQGLHRLRLELGSPRP